jgi:hypothetical protein
VSSLGTRTGRRFTPTSFVDHEASQPLAVNEDEALDGARKLDRLSRERGSCDEHALAGPLPGKGTIEPVNLQATDGILPPFCLKVDLLKTESIERTMPSIPHRRSDRCVSGHCGSCP